MVAVGRLGCSWSSGGTREVEGGGTREREGEVSKEGGGSERPSQCLADGNVVNVNERRQR